MLPFEEIRKRLSDYFTLKDNEIICDFCENSYDIIINIEEVRNHLKEKHKDDENAVSSESTEEDLKKSYTIHNNTINCEHCEHSYIPWNAHSIIQYHLGDGHQTDNFNVEGMRNLIREKYELNESVRKQYCKNCRKDIQNKLVDLINHLHKVHNDTDHLNYRPTHKRWPNTLDDLFDNYPWIWNYYTRNGEYAQCSMCNDSYKIFRRSWYHMIQHITNDHPKIKNFHLKGSKDKSKEDILHYEIQEDLANCYICKQTVETRNSYLSSIQNHLQIKHGYTSNPKEIGYEWVFTKIDKLPGFQKSYCKYCKKKFQKMCPYSLSKHLAEVHGLNMYSDILSKGEASNPDSLSRSDENVINIPISSMNPQPGSSKSFGIEVRDVDCDRDNTMGNLKRKLSNLSSSDKNVKDIGTSSGEPQAGSSKDLDTDDRDSGMKKVKYDDDNCPPDEFCAPSSLITPLDNDEGIAGSSIDQESTSSSHTTFTGIDAPPDDPNNPDGLEALSQSLIITITPTDNSGN